MIRESEDRADPPPSHHALRVVQSEGHDRRAVAEAAPSRAGRHAAVDRTALAGAERRPVVAAREGRPRGPVVARCRPRVPARAP